MSESSSKNSNLVRCFSSAQSAERDRINTLFHVHSYMKKSQGVARVSRCPLGERHVVVRGSSNPSVREMLIKVISHVGRPVWRSTIQLEKEVVNVILQQLASKIMSKKWLSWRFTREKKKGSNGYFLDIEQNTFTREPIRGRRFATREDIATAVHQQVIRFTHGIANAETDGIQLQNRWQRVVAVAGDYIGGL
ncbi:hypothetical protein TNCV_649881 [Trichonephila clavipes]|nr:hypothetical protein TNCV_649881 [Trichonephila clavipes]